MWGELIISAVVVKFNQQKMSSASPLESKDLLGGNVISGSPVDGCVVTNSLSAYLYYLLFCHFYCLFSSYFWYDSRILVSQGTKIGMLGGYRQVWSVMADCGRGGWYLRVSEEVEWSIRRWWRFMVDIIFNWLIWSM